MIDGRHYLTILIPIQPPIITYPPIPAVGVDVGCK